MEQEKWIERPIQNAIDKQNTIFFLLLNVFMKFKQNSH